MVIFHCYVSSPEGKLLEFRHWSRGFPWFSHPFSLHLDLWDDGRPRSAAGSGTRMWPWCVRSTRALRPRRCKISSAKTAKLCQGHGLHIFVGVEMIETNIETWHKCRFYLIDAMNIFFENIYIDFPDLGWYWINHMIETLGDAAWNSLICHAWAQWPLRSEDCGCITCTAKWSAQWHRDAIDSTHPVSESHVNIMWTMPIYYAHIIDHIIDHIVIIWPRPYHVISISSWHSFLVEQEVECNIM